MLKSPGAVLLISCYDLGRQPLALASPLALLEQGGFRPAALDLAAEALRPEAIRRARLIAISVPMHTALRLGVRAAAQIRKLNPGCHICYYGSYASLNATSLLADHGADSIIGGEFEEPLLRLAESIDDGAPPPRGVRTAATPEPPWLERILFAVPSRAALPPLDRYARLEHEGETRIAGQVEATRGCLHRCRHCPLPPVYGGRFFVVPRDIVLGDIRNQVSAGATHITFADADFLNGPGHVFDIVAAMHDAFPALTFDFTAKVTHLLQHHARLPELARLGCLFIVTAVESLSPTVLKILDKGHTAADVLQLLGHTRRAGIALRPSLLPFTPWSGLHDYRQLLDFIAEEDLIDHIDPVQLSIRLLIPPGSLLAARTELKPFLGPIDQQRFTYTWSHADPRVDRLQQEVSALVEEAAGSAEDPRVTFVRIGRLADAITAGRSIDTDAGPLPDPVPHDRGRPPRLTEPWFC